MFVCVCVCVCVCVLVCVLLCVVGIAPPPPFLSHKFHKQVANIQLEGLVILPLAILMPKRQSSSFMVWCDSLWWEDLDHFGATGKRNK